MRWSKNLPPNLLCLRLQPDEGICLNIMTKDPGPGGMRMATRVLDMSFSEGQEHNWRMPDAYERLILDVVRGDQTLFIRGDEVIASWEWIDPIIESWQSMEKKPETYEKQSQGPISSFELIAKDNRRWRKIGG